MYAFYVGLGVRSLVNTYTELKKTTGLYDGITEVIGADVTTGEIYNRDNLINHGLSLLNVNRADEAFY